MADNNNHDDGHDEGGHHVNYFRIYIVLVILFLISVAGPEIGELTGLAWITLVTAFGIAFVKANLVIQNFMHLRWEKRLMKWMLTASVVCMALLVAGIAPDILNHEGQNWENVAAKAATERGLGGDGHGESETEVAAEAEPEPAGFSASGAYSTTCATCHGAAGDGAGPAGAALDPAPANFTDPAFWADRDRDRLVTAIREGAAAVGGSSLMVAWGFAYDDGQINEIIDYLETFRPDGD